MSIADPGNESPQAATALRDVGEAPAITVSVNGTAHTLPAGSTVAQLVERLGHQPQHIATAVNGDFVARAMREARVLGDGDQVHCFQPIGGG